MKRTTRHAMFIVALSALIGACDEDETVDMTTEVCPNAVPEGGTTCPSAGLTCNYFTGCTEYYPAVCGSDLKWSFTDECVRGTGGSGGGTAGAGAASEGGAGGTSSVGGSGGATGGSGGSTDGGTGGTGGAPGGGGAGGA